MLKAPLTSASAPLSIRVFLLDDNAIDRETCRRHLSNVETVSYQFIEHFSVECAVDRVRESDPQCILLDYHLRDGTGLQFLDELAAIGGPLRYPVVMLTGTGSEKIAVEVMKTGAQDYLSKDNLNPDLLHRAIEGAIYRARTERLLKEQRVEMERLFEEAQRANARKDEFLANLSHELRTPLTPVLAAVSQSDFEGVTTEDLIETFAMIRRNIEIEARLIDDLLDLTRISSGKLQIHARAVNPHEILRFAAEACDAERRNKSISLQWDLTAGEVILHADAGRLQQVFWNLFKNAVKFSHPGATITVKSRIVDSTLEIEVADTGIGLPTTNTESLFTAFEQGGSEVTRKFGGLGLGLAISKALVLAHGGSIDAANQSNGNGAVFTVRLPYDGKRSVAHVQASVPPTVAVPMIANPTLLLVEDHPDSASILRRMLIASGYRVHVANSVKEALELFSTHHVDCIISDLGLPDATGFELMERISSIRVIPAIALSGFGMENDVQRSYAAGFQRHITKPVDMQLLLGALQAVLENGAQRTSRRS